MTLDCPDVDRRVRDLLTALSTRSMANPFLNPNYVSDSTVFSTTQIAMIQDMLKSIVTSNCLFTSSSVLSFGINVVDLIWYLKIIDGLVQPSFHSDLLKEKLTRLFKAVPGAGNEFKLILTWERGLPWMENRPLSFSCLGPTNTSSTEISLSQAGNFYCGGSYFYSMNTLTKYTPSLGSLACHIHRKSYEPRHRCCGE